MAWDAGYPKTATGSIKGKGTYTTDEGWIVTSVQLSAVPTGGGEGPTQKSGLPNNGKWGELELTSVAKGQYTVQAALTFKKGTETKLIYSPTSIVNVP